MINIVKKVTLAVRLSPVSIIPPTLRTHNNIDAMWYNTYGVNKQAY